MTERISIYAGPPILAALNASGDTDNRSGRLNTVCERYMVMVADELARIALTKNEWMAILDANNGIEPGAVPGHASMTAMVWANVHDSRELSDKWEIDQPALVKKLQAMPRAALIAIMEVCDRFWSRAEEPTDAVLTAAGVTPTAEVHQ
jgi:hypothetical protein